MKVFASFLVVVVVAAVVKESKALPGSALLNGTPFYRTLPASLQG